MGYFRRNFRHMRIGIAGYGRMGHEVEKVATTRGHEVRVVAEAGIDAGELEELLRGTDVVIEFTLPAVAPNLVSRILSAGVPVVSGSTGWLAGYDNTAALAVKYGTAFIHSSNYSPGVYIMTKVNSFMAQCLNSFDGYRPSITEIHHTAKLDAPSGTAIMLAGQIVEKSSYAGWQRAGEESSAEIPVSSVRSGSVPGTHHVKWTSEEDAITLSHEAFGRQGFALGAVMAAEFISGKQGVFTTRDVFGF
ncbi:MAG: 4-hydroxy-tetrahydrodipicolinate reductase [Bacteroidetes bacterium]|nr:4-hydroxy-tetrahydrodipicolinate reductase [Bacteroidota bacterium]